MKTNWYNSDIDYMNGHVRVVLFVGSHKKCLKEINGFFAKSFFNGEKVDVEGLIKDFDISNRYGWCANASYDNVSYQIIKMEKLDPSDVYDMACFAHECSHAAINIVKRFEPDYDINVSDEKVPRLVQKIFKNLLLCVKK